MLSNSSETDGPRALAWVPAAKARHFLLELANLRNEMDAGKRFILRFVGLWPIPGRYTRPLFSENITRAPGAKSADNQINEMLHEHWILPLRDGVRGIWTAPTRRTKLWGVFRILDEVVFKEDQSSAYAWPFLVHPDKVVSLPPLSAFEQALEYLIRPEVRTYFCANRGCPTPYFFPTHSGQKYCSEACAKPAQRKFKRIWWRAHGKEWRKKRKHKRSLKRPK